MFSKGMWILTVILGQALSHSMVVNESDTDKDGGDNDRNQKGCEKRLLGYWVSAHVAEQADGDDGLDAMTDVFVMRDEEKLSPRERSVRRGRHGNKRTS